MAMKAIILAAGVGRRLGDSVTEHPKCLLEIGGRTLLARMLDALSAVGVTEQVVVIGHLGDQIQAAVSGRVGVRTIENPDYRKGAILSLWSARAEFDDDLLVMDADVLFPSALLRRLVESPHGNCFLMDTTAEDNGEAQMLMALDGRVFDIARGVRAQCDAFGESVGFLKLERAAVETLRGLLGRALEAGEDGIEHEEVYPALMRECVIGYEVTGELPWLEIDFPEDVVAARALLPQLEALERNQPS
jgi:choline kinase